jgi:site-specific DNA-methyltransferase (adenine-specific)
VSRFFYSSKASKRERGEGNTHPTVKNLSLICYLTRLITPPGGICLDPFMGSGTLALACIKEGFNYIGFEKEEEYYKIALSRISALEESKALAEAKIKKEKESKLFD